MLLIYVKSKCVARYVNYKGKKQIVNLREMKLDGPQREDPFSSFPTMQDSNQPIQLQRLARMLKFSVEQVYQLYFPGSEQQSLWSDYADV